MYIINPTIDQLSEWFCCGKHIAEYLQLKHKIPLIHRKGKKFYFAKSEQLNSALGTLPFLVKIFESL